MIEKGRLSERRVIQTHKRRGEVLEKGRLFERGRLIQTCKCVGKY